MAMAMWLQDPEALCEYLVSLVPPLTPLWAAHLRQNFGSALPDLFMGEVAEWFSEHPGASEGTSDDRRTMCRVLDEALKDGSTEVRELVQVSFVENLPAIAGDWFYECFGEALRADFERFAGKVR
jgi:hypothetical protein